MLHNMRVRVGEALDVFTKDWLYGKSNLIGVEIGSYAGESAEIFLKSNAFKKLYCIDPWEMGYDPNDFAGDEGIYLAEKVFDEKFKNNPIVTKLKMKSFDASRLFELDSLDFVYIDGNHKYEFIKSDLMSYYPRVKKGGIISGHDYEWKGTPDVKRAVDEFFNKPPIKKYPDHSWIYIKE